MLIVLARRLAIRLFQDVHSCARDVYFRLSLVVRVLDMLAANLSQALYLIIMAIFVELLVIVVKIARFLRRCVVSFCV